MQALMIFGLSLVASLGVMVVGVRHDLRKMPSPPHTRLARAAWKFFNGREA